MSFVGSEDVTYAAELDYGAKDPPNGTKDPTTNGTKDLAKQSTIPDRRKSATKDLTLAGKTSKGTAGQASPTVFGQKSARTTDKPSKESKPGKRAKKSGAVNEWRPFPEHDCESETRSQDQGDILARILERGFSKVTERMEQCFFTLSEQFGSGNEHLSDMSA